ncbi:MAG: hypothetical protein DMG84_22925 [Acidobacteria bacterium]|nr:MAG: hypothetical protein DMG84_22925 [Acidobacteriota bacterium]
MAHHFGRSSPPDPCLSCPSRWQHDLEAAGWTCVSLLRRVPADAPGAGVASLTLVLASLFLIEGILNIVLFFQMRSMRGSGWMLGDGIITLLLGLLIYLQWPSSSTWAIGTLVGVSMIISGVTRVMFSLAVRKVAAAAA